MSPDLQDLPPSVLHLELEQEAKATLALFVDEVFTVGETALVELRLCFGFTLRNRDLLALQGDGDVLGRI